MVVEVLIVLPLTVGLLIFGLSLMVTGLYQLALEARKFNKEHKKGAGTNESKIKHRRVMGS